MHFSQLLLWLLLTSFVANAFAWKSDARAVAHDLDHAQHLVIASALDHFDAHSSTGEHQDQDFDKDVHQLLHAAGYLQPFAITSFQPLVSACSAVVEKSLLPVRFSKSEPDPLFRPPRITS